MKSARKNSFTVSTVVFAAFACILFPVNGFSVGTPHCRSPSSHGAVAVARTTATRTSFLNSVVISADSDASEFDTGLGGVRLAQESAIRLDGVATAGKGATYAKLNNLSRFRRVTAVDASKVEGVTVLGTGMGQEIYKDPGTSLQAEVQYAPLEAAKDVLNMLKSSGAAAKSDSKYVANVLGGDDLQMLEVLEAVQMVAEGILKKKGNLSFNSLSYQDFPQQKVSMTVVELPTNVDDADSSGVGKALGKGEVYFQDGTYWTVLEDDLNPDVE